MPEPGLDSPEAARFYERGPTFEEMSRNMTPEQKHRYTQVRKARIQMYKNRGNDFLDENGTAQWRGIRDMLVRPDERELFEFLDELETDTEAESLHPLGEQYGDKFAAPKKPAAKPQTQVEPVAGVQPRRYIDLNSRPVGFSERTFLPQPKPARSRAAAAMLKKGG